MPPDEDPTDCTTDPAWQIEQTDRLIAWEYLQSSLGAGAQISSDSHLLEKIAVPASFWYDIISKARRAKVQNHATPNSDAT